MNVGWPFLTSSGGGGGGTNSFPSQVSSGTPQFVHQQIATQQIAIEQLFSARLPTRYGDSEIDSK